MCKLKDQAVLAHTCAPVLTDRAIALLSFLLSPADISVQQQEQTELCDLIFFFFLELPTAFYIIFNNNQPLSVWHRLYSVLGDTYLPHLDDKIRI